MNHGGAAQMAFGRVKLTAAVHSSSLPDGSHGGNPCGFTIETSDGNFHYSGDTALTLDMKLIPDQTKLRFAVLPIGDFFTMGIEDALRAADLLGVKTIVGVHYEPSRRSNSIVRKPCKPPGPPAKNSSSPPSAKPSKSGAAPRPRPGKVPRRHAAPAERNNYSKPPTCLPKLNAIPWKAPESRAKKSPPSAPTSGSASRSFFVPWPSTSSPSLRKKTKRSAPKIRTGPCRATPPLHSARRNEGPVRSIPSAPEKEVGQRT